MRPVDLARSAEVSTQQVRNLEAAGVLPPAERSASGYRSYRDEHLSALHCYQALVPGHGAPIARAIMSAATSRDLAGALALIDASHAALHEQRRTLDETAGALAAVGAGDTGASPAPLSIGELARHLGVRTSALRVWERAGLLSPARQGSRRHRRYDADDIRDAGVIHLLRQGRYLFDRIGPVIRGIRGSGSTDALHSALEERRASLTRRAGAMLHGAAVLHEHLRLIETHDPWP